MKKNRLRKLISLLKKEDRLPYAVFSLKNIEYLTGFVGSNGYLVIIDENRVFFITDSRYEEYSKKILPADIEFVLQQSDPSEEIGKILEKTGQKALFLEEHSLKFSFYLQLKNVLPGVELLPGNDFVNELRITKDNEEIKILKEAAHITDKCIEHLCSFIKPGMTEWDIAIEIDFFYKRNGCTKTSFDSIVASGMGASMPHYMTSSEKQIQGGDSILIDMGCTYKSYNSDLTRTVFLHSVDQKISEIYNIVLEAQINAVKSVKPGITTAFLDSVARNYITEAGYGDYFSHSLGHGVGLDIHELPAVKASGDRVLEPNMVITIEPGIYIPGVGGVRIEDMVLVTGSGYEVLTEFTKDIFVIK